jgi:adenylate cyclase class IV
MRAGLFDIARSPCSVELVNVRGVGLFCEIELAVKQKNDAYLIE